MSSSDSPSVAPGAGGPCDDSSGSADAAAAPATPTAPGPEAFDVLEAREAMSVGSQAAAAKGMVYTPAPDFVIGDPELRANAERLGFRWVGSYQFTGQRSKKPLVREAWVDGLGVVRLSLRRALTEDPIEGGMAPYYLSSTFDDGVEISCRTAERSPA